MILDVRADLIKRPRNQAGRVVRIGRNVVPLSLAKGIGNLGQAGERRSEKLTEALGVLLPANAERVEESKKSD